MLKCVIIVVAVYVTILDHDESLLNLALIQYVFDGEEHSVVPRPHGNSKKGLSYVRTMPSTLQKLKKVAVNLTPKFAICDVGTDVLTAPSAGALPRNRKQVKDMRRQHEEDEHFGRKKKDPLFSVMLICKRSQGKNSKNAFVRIVTCAPEPMTVLVSDWTLNDLERFCTISNCTVLCIDPTFSLGDFDVTVTTYKHPMLVNSSGNHPVMMGPVMIQKQKFETYHFFASPLVALKSSLRNLRAFGTDGEKTISNVMHVVFDKAVHLRCFLYFRGNLDSKLKELGVPSHVRIEFLRDVFGNPSNMQSGIVDADDEDEYEAIVNRLSDVWNRRETPYSNPPCFHAWFVKHYTDDVKSTMLKPKRILCGLGNPPDPFYTNDVESMNSVIKHQTQYKAQELPDFVKTIEHMIDNQKKEIEKAVVGIGEYQIDSDYKHLLVPARKFYQMTGKQKERRINAFFTNPLVKETRKDDAQTCSNDLSSQPPLLDHLPSYVAEKIQAESEKLTANKSCIVASPGCASGMEWVVQSFDDKHRQPYFVECRATGQILCEKSCTLYSSCKVCAHTVAVARRTCSLEKYMVWFQKQRGSLNVSSLADVHMPKGAGKKPCRKASQKRIKAMLEQTTSPLTPLSGGSENYIP